MSKSKTNPVSVRRATGLESELVQLGAWAQEELAAQRALIAALREQEAAIRAGSTQGLLDGTQAVQDASRSANLRERRRVAGMRALARRFGVDARALTLKSVAERASAQGIDSTRLLRAREELREAAAEALRRGRRIASLARHHRGVVDELFRTIAGRAEAEAGTHEDDALVVDRQA